MESTRGRKGIGAGRAGAIAAIVAGLVALPPAFAGEDVSSSAPPPDADGIVGNEQAASSEAAAGGDGSPPADGGSAADAPAVAAPNTSEATPEPSTHSAESAATETDAAGKLRDDAKLRAACANADAPAETLSNVQIAKSIRCLVNDARKDRGRSRLSENADLGKAARRHSVKMEAQNCFEHKCDGEPGLGRRVKQSGYTDGADRWRYAENLGCSKTTQGMLDGWLTDPRDNYFNKRNLLNRKFRDVGVGIVHGSPITTEPIKCPEGDETATYTLVLAFRKG